MMDFSWETKNSSNFIELLHLGSPHGNPWEKSLENADL